MLKKLFYVDTGLLFETLLYGKLKGEDNFGNRYYSSNKKGLQKYGREKRWFIPNNSQTITAPPSWDAWLRFIVSTPINPTSLELETIKKAPYGALNVKGYDDEKYNEETLGIYKSWNPNE